MSPPPRVHVLGELMVDVLVKVHTAPAPGSDAPATIADSDGGSAANVAAWLASLGTPVAFIARLGADDLGAAASRRLMDSGVDVRAARDPRHATGRCVVLVTPDGERTMFPDPGANAHLSPSDVDTAAWSAGEHLHVSGYSLIREGSRPAALHGLEQARARGLSVSVDASSEAPLRALGASAFLDWLAPGDLLFANAAEAHALTGHADPAVALETLADLGLCAIVKQGARGALAARADGRWSAAAMPSRAQDSTGAGDAFAAGFLHAWTHDRDMARALESATRVAARAVSRPGGRP